MCLFFNVLKVSYLSLRIQILPIPFCYSYPRPIMTKGYHVSPSLARFLPHEKTTLPRRSGAGGVDLRRYRWSLLPGNQRVGAGGTNKKGGQRSGGGEPGGSAWSAGRSRARKRCEPGAELARSWVGLPPKRGDGRGDDVTG